MLTDIEIQSNKDRFLDLVKGITRNGIDMDRLIAQLTESDFFEAPASAYYHHAFKGGLCLHSLNVYDSLKKLCSAFYTSVDPESSEASDVECPYSEDSIRIVSLFHDFDKINKYELSFRNKKVYSETGSKYDELGKYEWVSVPEYKRKDDKDIFILGTHGENSVYMTETFIPLSTEEHAAILAHHSVYDNPKANITGIYSRYHLACLLHTADMISTYILES